ncbi:hypothetical protein [Mangrovibacterium diazotrophicum]|uniref:Uncharacterized protein n=1 Tax=Mangrovibacterium diazotrophicum TaxID=1261403 RepID=A0A419W8J2_9BACT|nr:hypothetical protein [Mangrovibacterium diazotrophicum]RKD91791.1 hypothetical protein BC643_2157 [Mangrovibacterium diazotrophicum]
MKKQFLIQTFLALVLMAGVNHAQGQATAGSATRGVNCTDGPLNPISGKEYTYQATSNQTGDYTFWSTQDMAFISTSGGVTTTNISTMFTSPTTTPTGTDLIATSANYGVAAADDNVKITWSDATLALATTAEPIFVAVHQTGDCTNNFEAWKIAPIKAFIVDIRNIDPADGTTPLAYDTGAETCFDEVRGANYNPTSGEIEYDFGTQVLFFEVVAANFTGYWVPTFTLSALGEGQTATIEWDYDMTFGSPNLEVSGTQSSVNATTNETNTSGGVSIYVRVTITNTTYEGLANEDVTLTVDGVNSIGDWDIQNNTLTDAGPLCDAGSLNDGMDAATQTLTPRPDVQEVAPTPFIPGNETPAP